MEDPIVIDESQQHDDDTAPEEADWRRRALAAESRLEQIHEELAETRATLDDAERKRQAERLLAEHGALDLETAMLLTEAAVAQMDEPDVAAAVQELRARKPFLFARASHASVMSGHAESEPDPIEDAAADARATGDRRVLLRYLRLKRTGA